MFPIALTAACRFNGSPLWSSATSRARAATAGARLPGGPTSRDGHRVHLPVLKTAISWNPKRGLHPRHDGPALCSHERTPRVAGLQLHQDVSFPTTGASSSVANRSSSAAVRSSGSVFCNAASRGLTAIYQISSMAMIPR